MDNSINFKGAFIIHQPSKNIHLGIIKNLGTATRKVFNNYTPEGDILYVVNKRNDKKIAEYLYRRKNIDFEYYPELDMQSGFNTEFYDEAKKIIAKSTSSVIRTIDELKEIFKFDKVRAPLKRKIINNSLENSLAALNLNTKDYTIKRLNGYNKILTKVTKDKKEKLVATISEPDHLGFRYAKVLKPDSDNPKEIVGIYAIKGDKIQFTYINDPTKKYNGMSTFTENYNRAVRQNRITHSAKHQ